MITDFARPAGGAAEPKRDQWGRPLIMPPGHDIAPEGYGIEADKPVPYTRVSTLAKCIDDTTNLTKWKMRQVATGIGKRPDLATVAQVLDPKKDKGKLNALCEDALNAAASGSSANIGTALHAFTEWVDSPGFDLSTVPAEYRGHIAEYAKQRDAARLTPIAMERFVVCDELQAAGTFDRLFHHPVHGVVCGDLKTGETAADYPHNIAMQVAVYARSALYDIDTGTRTTVPGINLEVGVLVHLNQTTGETAIYELDIARGWEAAQLAAQVHEWRKAKNLARPWGSAA